MKSKKPDKNEKVNVNQNEEWYEHRHLWKQNETKKQIKKKKHNLGKNTTNTTAASAVVVADLIFSKAGVNV